MLDESFATSDYSFHVEEETWYDCVQSDITYSGTVAKDKVIITAKNNGTKAAEFVEITALFFKDNKIVYSDSNFFTDNDFELKPGASMNKELNCFEEFDSYELLVTGRRTK